jgi:opacity protein-like surface antigen
MLNHGREVILMTNGTVYGRARLAVALAVLATLCAPVVASAQIRQVSASSDSRQTINFTLGYFALKGIDSRVLDDVLLNELQSSQPLLFAVKDFNSGLFGAEYLLAVSPHVEVGVGVGYSQRTVPSVYARLTHADNSEIQQELKLRQIPVTFTGRFLLLPRGSAVEPYVGAGVVAIRWRYSETGEFVSDNRDIFPARYVANGTAAGPTVLAGLRAPVGNVSIGGEVRWQKAEATKLAAQQFVGDKFDLGGWTGNFTFGVRF